VTNLPEAMINNAAQRFDQDGSLTDESIRLQIQKLLVALVQLARKFALCARASPAEDCCTQSRHDNSGLSGPFPAARHWVGHSMNHQVCFASPTSANRCVLVHTQE
jgi:hypothetical protein